MTKCTDEVEAAGRAAEALIEFGTPEQRKALMDAVEAEAAREIILTTLSPISGFLRDNYSGIRIIGTVLGAVLGVAERNEQEGKEGLGKMPTLLPAKVKEVLAKSTESARLRFHKKALDKAAE